ncbi:serine protease inhibitor 42Dd-like [Daktulosphaira vitifoliae]|uniref:serine protease inhibitor 42Dd-like n=1 Tax=Daktulosphaira vitifoliae TaxID=58002 RepID=UPI0021A9F949|nr:serine protease inhibitor 42Dd-like [Daktulosphaira vitifoliae]
MNMESISTPIEFLHSANNNFSLSLYREIQNTNGNLLFSPLSIQLVLFLASLGTNGKTYEEIRNITQIPIEWSDSQVLLSFKNLLKSFEDYDQQVKVATGIFVDNSFDLNSTFVNNARNYLYSPIEKLNFKIDPIKVRNYLNEWGSKLTDGLIKELFPDGSINIDTRFVLGNAIYFNDLWQSRFFMKIVVKEELFYNTLTDKVTVKMLTSVHDLNFYKDPILKFSMLEIPYLNDDFKVQIFLPDLKDGLAELESNLPKIVDLQDKLTVHNVELTLPKFKIEHSLELKSILLKMGCTSMFTKLADFSRMVKSSSTDVHVTSILHKTCVDFNENGTTAVALSGFISSSKSVEERNYEPPKAIFQADHPFIFTIVYDEITLFMGRLKHL